MALAAYQFINFMDMINGVNTVDSAIHLTTSDARDAQNIDLIPIGGFSKRNGCVLLNSSPVGSDACTGLYMARYSTAGGTNLAYLVSGSKIYKMSAALGGTWTDITGGLTITAGNNNIWNFGILNDHVVLGNGVDTPIQISSSGSASALSGVNVPFTSFLFCIESRGYMWYFVPIVGGVTYYDRGYFSDVFDPTIIDVNDYVDVAKAQGGDVRGAVDLRGYLYIFKRHGIYQVPFQPTQVDSAGDIFPWTQNPNPVVPGVGTQSHRSIVKFTTPVTHAAPGQELVFFVDQFGSPRIFDGNTTISFNSKIGSSRDTTIISLADMDRTRNPYCFAVNHPATNRIYCFLSETGSKQDTCWVMDYNKGFALIRQKFYTPFNVGTLFEKSDGNFFPYVGDYAGSVLQLDSGTNDNGNAIDAYYVTGDHFLKSPVIQNKFYFNEIRGITGATDQKVDVSYYIDGSDTASKTDSLAIADDQTTLGSFIWGQASWAKLGIVTKQSEIGMVGKTLRIKFQNSGLDETMVIEGAFVAGETLGTAQN